MTVSKAHSFSFLTSGSLVKFGKLHAWRDMCVCLSDHNRKLILKNWRKKVAFNPEMFSEQSYYSIHTLGFQNIFE